MGHAGLVPVLYGERVGGAMRLMQLRHICRLIGHRCESYIGGWYTDRRGRQREKWYRRCTRCGTSDGGEVYREGLLERFTWWRIRAWPWRVREALRTRICVYCGKPERRLGRKVGDHRGCIPF